MIPWLRGDAPFPPVTKALRSPNGLLCAGGDLSPERIVSELKDKAPGFADVDPAVVHLSGAIDNNRAPRPVTAAISALVNLGYGQPQAAAAIAAASRSAGEHAETAQLIRLGLKELAK